MSALIYNLWRKFARKDVSVEGRHVTPHAQIEICDSTRDTMSPVNKSNVYLDMGFTIVETLLALAILVLLTGVVAAGVPVAWRTYTKAVDSANAEVALTTTSALLRDELGLAQDVFYNKDTGIVVRYKTGDGYWASIDNPPADSKGKGLTKQAYLGAMPNEGADYGLTKSVSSQLVPDASLTGNLRVTYENIKYHDGLFTVEGLKVMLVDVDGTTTLAETGENAKDLIIRAVLL